MKQRLIGFLNLKYLFKVCHPVFPAFVLRIVAVIHMFFVKMQKHDQGMFFVVVVVVFT